MQEVKGRKQFAEPELIKCKEPLDRVTMQVYSGGSTSSSSSSDSKNCNFFEDIFGIDGC
ncbi:MAG TPA: hypothetical protein VLB01_07790 [Thermodesulfobacteriota bacterium]|nr:hypothetical protein [Thermodesulfobacteriota bacterium]